MIARRPTRGCDPSLGGSGLSQSLAEGAGPGRAMFRSAVSREASGRTGGGSPSYTTRAASGSWLRSFRGRESSSVSDSLIATLIVGSVAFPLSHSRLPYVSGALTRQGARTPRRARLPGRRAFRAPRASRRKSRIARLMCSELFARSIRRAS
jgi:hypothetical protein